MLELIKKSVFMIRDYTCECGQILRLPNKKFHLSLVQNAGAIVGFIIGAIYKSYKKE